LPVRRWAYYCVDDFSQWPGYDGKNLARLEADLVKTVDDVIAVSETLRDRLRHAGRDSHLLTHGIDPDFWRTAGPTADLPCLEGLRRPVVLFWGLVDRRMDLTFVRALADALRGSSTVVIVGPEDDPDPQLQRIDGVARVGVVPFEQLPALAAHASVLIMPYAD